MYLNEAGDIASVVTGAVGDLSGQLTTVAAAGIGIGVVMFGVRKAWGFFKSTAK